MNDLQELYARKSNFPAYRLTLEAEENSADNPVTILYHKLEAAKQELKATTSQLQNKIATIKLELMEAGAPISKTDRKKAFDLRMRDQKKQVDEEFSELVVNRLQAGDTVRDLVREVGAANGSMFYNATSGRLGMMDTSDSTTTKKAVTEFEYHEHTGVHRYGMTADRKHVKLHNTEGESVVLTYPNGSYYSGNKELVNSYQLTRAEMLEKLLDGTYDGPTNLQPNPYK